MFVHVRRWISVSSWDVMAVVLESECKANILESIDMG